MRPHIHKAYLFLDAHLPKQYVSATKKILNTAEIKTTDHIIRNVRLRASFNIDVLNALLKVAKKNKKANEKLAEATNN